MTNHPTSGEEWKLRAEQAEMQLTLLKNNVRFFDKQLTELWWPLFEGASQRLLEGNYLNNQQRLMLKDKAYVGYFKAIEDEFNKLQEEIKAMGEL